MFFVVNQLQSILLGSTLCSLCGEKGRGQSDLLTIRQSVIYLISVQTLRTHNVLILNDSFLCILSLSQNQFEEAKETRKTKPEDAIEEFERVCLTHCDIQITFLRWIPN